MAQKARITKLRETMSGLGLDAFLISQPESRRYLSNFTGADHPPMDSAGYLLITDSRAILLTDGRTTEQAERESPLYEIVRIDDGIAETLAQQLPGLHLSRLAFEGNHLPYRRYEEARQAGQDTVTMVPTYEVVDGMRAIKEAGELEAIRDAVTLADAAFAHFLSVAAVGATERELAWEIETFLRKNGSEGVAFDPIVAAGPNASMAHHVPTDRAVQAGEPIIIDWGARVGGYCSDVTRTIVLGEADEQFRKVYSLVLEAQERAEQKIRPGVTGAKADSYARDVIAEAGMGELFSHSLGHGVGLAIHENPSLRRTSSEKLEEGMVFSIEPGIYIPGWGGVRIEDLATLRGGNLVVLTRSPKQLEAMEV